MPTVAVIPVKSFVLGKQRLSHAIDPATRAQLGRSLAEHVAATTEAAGLIPLVVTADPEVAEWSTLAGFPSVADPGTGLDTAAGSGVEWATGSGSQWIVIHADLPLLSRDDLTSLTDALTAGHDVIAPSADGGTSAVGATHPIAFSFGVSSFHRHLAMLDNPAVVSRRGLLLDVDSTTDLTAACSVAPGAWVRDVIGASGFATSHSSLY